MKYTLAAIALLVAQIAFAQVNQAAATPVIFTKNIETEIDALFHQAYPMHSPGATVLIAQADKILYRKAFGMANLELKVQMTPENVFQLASITKQFTSVAILMLMEQGKLSLQDPLSKFVADFPRGNEITVHHLLNHTSGITSYTNLPEFRAKTRLDLIPEKIIDSFKDLPLEFDPNEKYAYSNSGYVLLGHIIAQLSGMTYGEFIQTHIFDRLGMTSSCYADTYKIIAKRASGYQLYEGRHENAEYMSPTIPYAAGALMSTIDDMFLWNRAIQNNVLIAESSRRMAFTNHVLSNGKPTNYGYGWAIDEIEGISSLEHTGGINGFTASSIYVPANNIYSIVLTNLDDGVGAEIHNVKAVSALLGHSIAERVAVNLSEKELKKWVGAYQFDETVRFITYEDGALYSMREGGRPFKLLPLSKNEFAFENSLTTYQFSTKNGKRQALYADRIVKSMGMETDKKPIAEKEAITLAKEVLLAYVGVYELQPSFQIKVELQDDRLMAIATGQPPIELLAETENRFFIREIGAQMVFNKSTDGSIISLTFSQGGNDMEGKRIR